MFLEDDGMGYEGRRECSIGSHLKLLD